ncbi:hypothetical protein BB559_005003 [Furculomyces boomerangus]|uniref:Uncharacterized protein n=1 Tax=Furculomyces boomerangus TaxID=61424 RepID=A0A2T9YBG3_9FUNG|nr:hypothetical protein BB559_005003 [Furculomyces boomerangus]
MKFSKTFKANILLLGAVLLFNDQVISVPVRKNQSPRNINERISPVKKSKGNQQHAGIVNENKDSGVHGLKDDDYANLTVASGDEVTIYVTEYESSTATITVLESPVVYETVYYTESMST